MLGSLRAVILLMVWALFDDDAVDILKATTHEGTVDYNECGNCLHCDNTWLTIGAILLNVNSFTLVLIMNELSCGVVCNMP